MNKNFKCPMCNYVAHTKSDLENHVNKQIVKEIE